MAEESRIERMLTAKLQGKEYTGQPLSRVEELLLQLGNGSGGGSEAPVLSGGDFSDSDIADIMSVISTEND